ncbi:MAG TPA: TIGR01212 family radical SAM protein [Sulfurospirillum sp. UBA12182]|nr:MAG TPA: TIGR01212 family radical SAM protein [Sulfurospirillum sp. UBA12182]
MSRYLSYKEYMLQTYGHVLYSVPVDLDFGCPNRSFEGEGGCTFCPANGARAVQTGDTLDIKEQIEKGVAFAKKRYKAHHFMLYIQAYTGTFSSLALQKASYEKLLALHEFKAISIGTRPDCLSEGTLKYLQELNKTIEVCIDLGVQTLNDITLKKINRGHDAKTSLEAIKRLKEYGIKVFGHIIVGFEGESRADWEYTVKELVKAGVDGIKIHNLHVIENTLLAKEFLQKPFKTFNEYEYLEELIHLLRLIPSHIPLLRTTTDTPHKQLIAPKWHMSKGEFLRMLDEQMQNRDAFQGDFFTLKTPVEELDDIVTCKDGSLSFWDKKYKDYYHPKAGAIFQAQKLFIECSKLANKLTCKDVNLLDIGFGMGYNSLEALKIEHQNFLHIDAIDINLQIVRKSAKVLQNEILQALYEKRLYQTQKAQISLHIQDARYAITKLKDEFYDVIFIDPFLYTQNVTLITRDFFIQLVKKLKKDGVIVCSTYIQAVRVGLGEAGCTSEVVKIEQSDIRGIVAFKGKQSLEGVSYKDPYLIYRDKVIITNKEAQMLSE